MFDNIGTKIKKLASVIYCINLLISFAVFLILLIVGMKSEQIVLVAISFPCLLLGLLFSWVGSFFMYGFGRLIENSDELLKKITNN